MKTFEEIENTGEWWLGRGWERNTIGAQQRYSPDEIVAGVETLKLIFSADWFRTTLSQGVRNIVAANLIYTGIMSYDFIIHLSRIVRSLQNSQGFQRVCEKLKTHESESAYLELTMAYIFRRHGIEVEFPKTGKDKTPDIIAYCADRSIAIECKWLRKQEWEIWGEKLHMAVHSAVMAARPDRRFKIQLKLDSRLSDIHFENEKEPAINEAINAAIVASIKDIVNKLLEANILPVNFKIADLVYGTLFPEDADVEEVTSGAEISTIAKFRHILTNGFLRATEQLPKEMPGVIAVYSDYLPEPPFARIIFDAITKSQQERFQHVAALLIFPFKTIFKWIPPMLLVNRYSAAEFSTLDCATVIKNELRPNPC